VAILNFQMVQTVTTHVKDIHRNIFTRFQFNPFSGSWEEVSWKSTNQNFQSHRTEFNQTWQRCFLWGPKKLSWFVLTRPTHWVPSLLCIGQFVMPIILTWVLFCSKCAELLLDQEKQRVTI
jgi:hypothetical protein